MEVSDWPFTPEAPTGGWHISVEDEFGGYIIAEEQAEGDWNRQRGWPEVDTLVAKQSANVNLIAAAPRMYRALKLFFESIERPWSGANQTAALDEMREVLEWIDQR